MDPDGMLIQIWAPSGEAGMKIVRFLERRLGFYDVPDLAEWYHHLGYIMDISPAPARKQEEKYGQTGSDSGS